MNTTRKRVLIYGLLTLLFTMACEGCYIFPGAERTVGEFKCVSEGYSFAHGTSTYRCACPLDPSYSNSIIDITAKDFTNPAGMRSKACSEYYLDNQLNQQTIPATEPPTEEPAPTEPPAESAPLQPLLKGTVSACDTAQGFINFPLAESNPNIAGKTLGVTINGTVVNCGIPSTNTSVLACPLPPGVLFPINVSVTLDGFEVNNFKNDGYFCTNTPSGNGGESSTGGEGTTTEEEPVVPLSCVPDPDDPYSCLP